MQKGKTELTIMERRTGTTNPDHNFTKVRKRDNFLQANIRCLNLIK